MREFDYNRMVLAATVDARREANLRMVASMDGVNGAPRDNASKAGYETARALHTSMERIAARYRSQ